MVSTIDRPQPDQVNVRPVNIASITARCIGMVTSSSRVLAAMGSQYRYTIRRR